MIKSFNLWEMAKILLAGAVVGLLGFITQDGVTWKSLFTPPLAVPQVSLNFDYQTIELPEALKLFHSRDTVFVDLREKKYFDYGSIQGAENLDPQEVKSVDAQTLKRWKAKSAVVVYCNGVGCPTVFFEAKYLASKGLTNIKVYEDGWPEWRSSGLPMAMSPAMKKSEVVSEQ